LEVEFNSLPAAHQGDMVFENGCLFLQNALLTWLFADAIKSGDSGLVILVLKQWSFAYQGNGRMKYAHEMLHLLHNLTNVWTKEIPVHSTTIKIDINTSNMDRKVVTKNWLLNLTGRS
jgi:hypothetical protein